MLNDKTVLHPGNTASLTGSLQEIMTATNPGMFDRREYYKEKGVYYELRATTLQITSFRTNPVKDLLYRLRNRMGEVYTTSLPAKESGIVSAMILGDKSLLDIDIRQLYQESGIGHLLAISGLHVSILCMALIRFFKHTGISERIFIPAGIGLVLAYGQMTDFSISTSRAVIMMILLLAADLFERTYDGKNSLAIAAVIILLQKPFALFSCSFLLSFGAMAGIYFIVPFLVQIWSGDSWQKHRRRRQRHFSDRELCANHPRIGAGILFFRQRASTAAGMLLISSAIQLTTLPVILYFFSEVPLYGILINLLVIPLAALLVILSFLGGLTGCICPIFGTFLLSTVYWLLSLYEKLCQLFKRLPGHVLILGRPAVWQIILYYILLCGLLLWMWRRSKQIDELEYQHSAALATSVRRYRRLAGQVIPFVLILVLLPVPSGSLELVVLDVGQGDGIYLHTPSGQNILVDGGSTSENQVGKYRILPFLKTRGIRYINYMIATHADEDHINGLAELMQMSGDSYRIGTLLLPDVADKAQEGYQLLIQTAQTKNITVAYLSSGANLTYGALSLLCLNPPSGSGFSSANDESIVLSLRYNDFSCLLTGDLAGEGEEEVRRILASASLRKAYNIPEHYTLLKIAHHGSKNSSDEELLSLIRPEYALISCGRHNRYGHPHKELLQRLKNCHAGIFRTDQSGALTVTVKRRVTIRGYLDKTPSKLTRILFP